MESKRKARDRKIGIFLVITVVILLIVVHVPLIMQKIHAPTKNNTQSVHGFITTTETRHVVQKTETLHYTVRAGDTLIKLATCVNDSVEEIVKRNHIANPNLILIGQVITLKRASHVSPDMAMLKASSEKFSSHTRASQKKLFTKKSPAKRMHRQVFTHIKNRDSISKNCALVGGQIRDVNKRLIARAVCIRHHYGAFIKEAVTTVSGKVSELEIVAIMLQESKGNPRAISNAQIPCLGLMQIQPPTARQYHVKNLYNPRENILGGARVLTDYIYRYGGGDRAFGIAAYNMGPNNRIFRGSGFDPNELKYVREVRYILHILKSRQFTL